MVYLFFNRLNAVDRFTMNLYVFNEAGYILINGGSVNGGILLAVLLSLLSSIHETNVEVP